MKSVCETRLYHVWEGMKARCYYEKADNYPNYGGRGVVVCEEWKHNFLVFQEWALNNGYVDTLQIDRVDNDGDYSPSNCRWVTNKQNNNNRGDCVFVEYKGETHTLKEWSEIYNIPYQAFWQRIKKLGWEFERALITPLETKFHKKRGL